MKKLLIGMVLIFLAGCKEIPEKKIVCPKCMGPVQVVGPWTIDNDAPKKGVLRVDKHLIYRCENCGNEEEK